ncbi:MAG: heme-copper oxidase subunit III [Candidatus Tectomicrobia bacterium]|nr:heme-copper oxidase subunit III [Candidatus Tectomicrobia bacterium]
MNAAAQVSAEASESTGFPSAKLGMWWFLASEIMVFGGLISAYLLFRMGSAGWAGELHHNSTLLGTVNTLVLLTSSFTMVEVHRAHGTGAEVKFRLNLALTILLGLVFLGIKGTEYAAHIREGLVPAKSLFWAFYFGMTGLHGLHVLGGIVANACLYAVAARPGGVARYGHRAEMNGLYWHFVDVVWIFLFPLLYLG